jgi:DNA helicase HerA-like ATPase
LALSSQARKYGLGLVFATQAPKSLDNQIPGNAATQFYGLLNAPAQIETAKEMARAKGGLVPDISRLRAGGFYVATEGQAFHRIVAPWCLTYHPPSPLSPEEVLGLARGD